MNTSAALARLTTRMEEADLPARLIATFAGLYQRYADGDTGKLPWHEIEAPQPQDIVESKDLSDGGSPSELLNQLVCIKLNGGLGTSMKLRRAKSIIPVRDNQSFLDLTAAQLRFLRRRYGARTPLVLMNSFNTRSDSLAALQGFAQPDQLPLDFLQHKFPRIDAKTRGPTTLEVAERNWAPPGHGDVYLALLLSGVLEQLLTAGYRWAFVSNADNLGATPDLPILSHLAKHDIEFAMEVTAKTRADIKGGTLVRHRGKLTLLERAQVEDDHLADFEDVETFAVFNTNNLWWNLEAIKEKLDGGELDLPLIVNPKEEEGQRFVQLESAMGAGIGCFDRVLGIRVPRTRFAPVKTTADLLAVRSDAYVVGEDGALRPNPDRDRTLGPPIVRLDDRFYTGLTEFDQRAPYPLQLVDCRSLTIQGDVRFGRDVTVSGDVTLEAQEDAAWTIESGTTYSNGHFSGR